MALNVNLVIMLMYGQVLKIPFIFVTSTDKSQTYCSTTAESKEGTLLHEWSHSFADTGDYSTGSVIYYGRDLCKELAETDPDNAVRNADNYCYHYCDAQ